MPPSHLNASAPPHTQWRAVSGNLDSRPDDINIKIAKFSLSYAGKMLINETSLEFNQGCRYEGTQR